MLLLFGCSYPVGLKNTKSYYASFDSKNRYLDKKGNCEFLGEISYTTKELKEIYAKTKLTPPQMFEAYESFALLADELIANETYKRGGNLYYYYKIYDRNLAHTELYERNGGKISAKMYKCECIFVDCV